MALEWSTSSPNPTNLFSTLVLDRRESKPLSRVWLFVIPWTIHGILQARILEWIAMPFSRGDLPNPGIEHWSPRLQADSLPAEPPGKPQKWEYQGVPRYEQGNLLIKICSLTPQWLLFAFRKKRQLLNTTNEALWDSAVICLTSGM